MEIFSEEEIRKSSYGDITRAVLEKAEGEVEGGGIAVRGEYGRKRRIASSIRERERRRRRRRR